MKSRRTGRSDVLRGSVLTELAIVLPILFTLTFGLVTVMELLSKYRQAALVLYEGVRTASSITGLQPNSDNSSLLAQARIKIQPLLNKIGCTEQAPPCLTLTFDSENNTIKGRLSFLFVPSVGGAYALSLPLSLSSESPYLYPREEVN